MHERFDYYEILQVHEKAEPEVIQAAYKRLAIKYHPDVNKSLDSEERMKMINIAYATLKEVSKRAEYDRKRIQGKVKEEINDKKPDEQKSEYHYQPRENERYNRADDSPKRSKYKQPPPEKDTDPLIRFCRKVDSNLQPIGGFEDVFEYNLKEIVCHIIWPETLPTGTEVKVVWYQNDEVIYRHHFEMGHECDVLVAGLTLSGLFASMAGSRWEVFVTKNNAGVGKARFRVRSKQEANVKDGVFERLLSGDRPKSILDRIKEMWRGER